MRVAPQLALGGEEPAILECAQLVIEAAAIKIDNKVSFADAFAATTAKRHDSLLVTGDPELRALPGIAVTAR